MLEDSDKQRQWLSRGGGRRNPAIEAESYPTLDAALAGLAQAEAHFDPENPNGLPMYFERLETRLQGHDTQEHHILAEAFDAEARAPLAEAAGKLRTIRSVLTAADNLLSAPEPKGIAPDDIPIRQAYEQRLREEGPKISRALQDLVMVETAEITDCMTGVAHRIEQKFEESSPHRVEWQRQEEQRDLAEYARTEGLEKAREDWDRLLAENPLAEMGNRVAVIEHEIPAIMNGIGIFAVHLQDRLNNRVPPLPD